MLIKNFTFFDFKCNSSFCYEKKVIFIRAPKEQNKEVSDKADPGILSLSSEKELTLKDFQKSTESTLTALEKKAYGILPQKWEQRDTKLYGKQPKRIFKTEKYIKAKIDYLNTAIESSRRALVTLKSKEKKEEFLNKEIKTGQSEIHDMLSQEIGDSTHPSTEELVSSINQNTSKAVKKWYRNKKIERYNRATEIGEKKLEDNIAKFEKEKEKLEGKLEKKYEKLFNTIVDVRKIFYLIGNKNPLQIDEMMNGIINNGDNLSKYFLNKNGEFKRFKDALGETQFEIFEDAIIKLKKNERAKTAMRMIQNKINEETREKNINRIHELSHSQVGSKINLKTIPIYQNQVKIKEHKAGEYITAANDGKFTIFLTQSVKKSKSSSLVVFNQETNRWESYNNTRHNNNGLVDQYLKEKMDEIQEKANNNSEEINNLTEKLEEHKNESETSEEMHSKEAKRLKRKIRKLRGKNKILHKRHKTYEKLINNLDKDTWGEITTGIATTGRKNHKTNKKTS